MVIAGFSVDGPQRVFRAQSGTVFLESGQQVEALARKEQRALQSQQVALEALAKQQSQANQRQQTLQAQFHLVEAKEQRMEELVKEQSKELLVAQEDKIKAELALEEQATGVQSARTRLALSGLAKTGTQLLQLAAASAADLSKEILRDQLIGAAVYFSLIMIAAFIYVTFFTYQYPMLKNQPVVYGDHFTFSLFECCNWDRDAPSAEIMRDRRIPCCSCCCLPVRWADTASSSKTGFLPFWPGVILIALLNAFTGMSFYVTSLLFTILATLHRQKIRKTYGLPYGSCSTCTEDFCTWTWCSCCATMQEAMEIQYIDPVQNKRPWQQTMDSLLPGSGATSSGVRQQNSACC
ncbi:unnamed protein product [Effrenium voratum]|uniref:Uncharacterized protein n=1 Tax=Effrenium voratum TaxID=2562239 RepID=A0AA36N322_9DINO|nr:unnamed protein product [Effrenium voratum]